MPDYRLIAAYRATAYHVAADPPLALRVGVRLPASDDLLQRHGVRSAAFLTAWNPLGQALDRSANDAAQVRLAQDVTAMGLTWLPGEGRGHDTEWPPEHSLFILGIGRSPAIDLSRRFRQNAFVWVNAGLAPELILTAPIAEGRP